MVSHQRGCACGEFGTRTPVLQKSTATTPTPAEHQTHQMRRVRAQRRQMATRPRVCKQGPWGIATDLQRAIGVPLRQAPKGHSRPLGTAKLAQNRAHTHEFKQFPS
jgi:hypothetical protein